MRWFVLASVATLAVAFGDGSAAHAFPVRPYYPAYGYYSAPAPVAPLRPGVAAALRFGRFGYGIAQQVLGLYGINLPNINLPNPPAQEQAKVSQQVFDTIGRTQTTLSSSVTETNKLLEMVRQNDKRFKVQNIPTTGAAPSGGSGPVTLTPGGSEQPQPKPE